MTIHVPVLIEECVEGLGLKTGWTVVDGTLGGGGHTRVFSEIVGPEGRVVALDRDPSAVATAQAWLPANVIARQANYADLEQVLDELNIEFVDAMLLDLGLSSDQLSDEGRGFSFHSSGPLDLRFDPTQGESASDLIARLNERDLADLIFQYGEERASRAVARRICEIRRHTPIRTARQLAELVRSCVRRSKGHSIDPATRTFQALRIAVNRELDALSAALEIIPRRLRVGGRLAVMSFHSLEDRMVKQAFRNSAIWDVVHRKPITAGVAERHANPRSRSAKLRVAAVRGFSP
ncbi:MAG TPA: 16S rRNA (cytosine(1402)-N(4))-methyltransferase RsmH [Pirellulaceae bacterium]|nr:16S rRNA (cytosine(1402)-N(4))-methyltransferase RsmH [Pirellulaceae bacterium]